MGPILTSFSRSMESASFAGTQCPPAIPNKGSTQPKTQRLPAVMSCVDGSRVARIFAIIPLRHVNDLGQSRGYVTRGRTRHCPVCYGRRSWRGMSSVRFCPRRVFGGDHYESARMANPPSNTNSFHVCRRWLRLSLLEDMAKITTNNAPTNDS